MTQSYELNVRLKEELWKEVFAENYKIQLTQAFVENKAPKEQNFINHVTGLIEQLKCNTKPAIKQTFSKWQIFVVSFGASSVGSEIQGDRPAILYKGTPNTLWDDVIVIPLTSAARNKKSDKRDLFVPKDAYNHLYASSFARIRQIKVVSLKRLGKLVGTINNGETKQAINKAVSEMLAIQE